MNTLEFNFEETFNPEEYLYFYENVLTPERLKTEIDFLVKFADLNQPLDILDLACGHGRHSNALSQLGHTVTGIDITEGFLEIARQTNPAIKYIHGDMREIKYVNAFDRVFVLFTAIGYFDDEQNEKVFQNIFSALKPGGTFVFDIWNRDTFITHYKPSSVVERDGNYLIDRLKFDPFSGRCITKRTVIYNQSIKNFIYSVRCYNPTDILKTLRPIGFSSVDFYESWEGKPLSQESKRMIVVAKKKQT